MNYYTLNSKIHSVNCFESVRSHFLRIPPAREKASPRVSHSESAAKVLRHALPRRPDAPVISTLLVISESEDKSFIRDDNFLLHY